jgi:acetolactate synthase-1/2/3 large subunit
MAFIYQKLQVETIFMVSGGGIMQLTDALACHGQLRYVCSHNEQATTMEADGYAKVRGGFGVALVTTGPGATNAITGVVGAWQDSTPVMVISGQSKRQQTIHQSGLEGLRQFGVQEAHILPMIASVTKYAAMLDDPCTVRYHLEKAAFLARHGRPGPVWLDVPLDVQGAVVDPSELNGFDPIAEGYAAAEELFPADSIAHEVADFLVKAERPIIMAGAGVRLAGAATILRQLVEQLNIPVVTPRLGIDLLATDHPLYIGRPGIKGNRAGNFAVQNADLLLCVGTRLSINVTGHEYAKFARAAKILVIDIDNVEHQKPTIAIDRFMQCDAHCFLEALMRVTVTIGLRLGDVWPDRCRDWKNRYPVVLSEYGLQNKPINTYQFTKVLSAQLTVDDVIVIDAGSSSYVVSQAISIKDGQRYLASGGLGAMGYAVPAALGASVARGGGRVIAITGDGSLHMNIQELITIAHERLPVKIFVFNNHSYASIKATQHNYFMDRYIGVDEKSGVALPDILKVADLYAIKGVRIENTEDMDGWIKEILSYDGPVLVDIDCSPDQMIIPTVFSKKKADGSMVSQPLEDMYPFLDRETFRKEMIIKPLDEEEELSR